MTLMTKNCLCRLALAGLALSGCSTLVSKTDSSPYAPKVSQKKGTVAYNPYGMGEIVQMRRESALKSIYDACGGSNRYQILREEIRDKDPSTSDTIATMGVSKLNYIDFQCQD